MNNLFIHGTVKSMDVKDKGIAFQIEVGWGDRSFTVPVWFGGGQESADKKIKAMKTYLKVGGEITLSGRLTDGKNGLGMYATNFQVGRWGPKEDQGGSQGSSSSGGGDDDLPF